MDASLGTPIPDLHLAVIPLGFDSELDLDSHFAGEFEPLALPGTGAWGEVTISDEWGEFSMRLKDPLLYSQSGLSFPESRLEDLASATCLVAPASAVRLEVVEQDQSTPVWGAVALTHHEPNSAPDREWMKSVYPHDSALQLWARSNRHGDLLLGGMIPEAEYVLIIGSPEHVASRIKVLAGGAGEIVDVGEVALARGCNLSVFVTDEEGSPVREAKVSLKGRHDGSIQRGFSGLLTDSDGSVQFGGLEPGSQSVRVSHVLFEDREAECVLQEGSSTNDLHVALGSGLRFLVKVVDGGGQPVRDARVALFAGLSRRRGTTDDSGEVSFNHVTEPRASIYVSARGFGRERREGVQHGEVVRIELSPGLQMNGRLVGLEDSAATEWWVGLGPPVGAPLQDVADLAGIRVEVRDEGRFKIPDLKPGEYVLVARSGAGEEFRAPFRLGDEDHEYVFKPSHPLRVHGMVVGADSNVGLPNVRVSFVGLESLTRSSLSGLAGLDPFSVSTADDGSFSVPYHPSESGIYLAEKDGYASKSFQEHEASLVVLQRDSPPTDSQSR